MVNRQNGFFAKLTGLTSSVFNLNLENIHDPVDENLTPLEKAVLYGNSSKKCRKIIFVKELVKSLNSIEYEDFKKDIYPLLVKLSNDKEEIQYELCCQMGDLCAYLLQSNNGPDGCEDIIKFLFPIIERIIRNSQGASIGGSADGGDVVANAMKALLILATHIKAKYRKSIIFPFILSLLSSEKFKNLGFVLLIKISYIFEKEIVSRHLFLCIETFVREKDEESKLFLSCYLHNICKIANEEELLVIFFILKSLCNDPNDTIKIISMYNCVHLSCLFSKSHFFHFFVPLFNDFLKNTNFQAAEQLRLGGRPQGGVAPSPVGEAQKTEEPPKTEEQHEAEKSRGVTQADILSNKKVHVPTGINSDSSKMPHDQSSQENVEISDASDGNHEEKREVQEETPLTMNCVRVSQNVINQPINMDEPKDEAEAQQMGGGRYYSKPNNNVKEEYSDGSVEANTLENVNGGENGITTQHSGLSLFPSSSSLLESSNGTSLLPSLLPSPSTSSLITPGATSIFVNNGFINDLIIRNNHFAVSVRQFFQIHGEEAKGGGEETKEKVPVHEQEYTHKGESQSGDDITNNKSVLLGEEEKKGKDPTYEGNYNDEFYNLTDNDITCIDRIYNHDKTIDIKQIKGWYYSDVDIIKGNMAYGTIFLHKEGKMDTSTERRPRKIHLNQKEDDIYNVETVNVEAIKKKFLFDTPNNIIVSHNINAVYITALHMPTLILVLKQHFFRFFSHVFFFVCTYPYYIIRKTMASLLYQILVNFLDPPNFLEVTTDELNQEEDMMIEFMKSGKNRILNRKSNFFSYPHLHKTDFEKDRGGKNYSTREEFPQVMQTFKMDYATYCNMKRIQSMQSVTSDEKISNMDNSSSSGHEVGESTPPTSNGLTEKQQGGDNFSDYGYLQEGPHDQAANQVDEDVRTKMDKESEEGVQDKNNAIKRVQSEINANLQEGDFFKNEENENFFFYKKFLQKYESVYERYIQRFRKYYSEDSSLFFFHFFIFYFLRDSNVLVKKAILKRYDKMVLLFPRMVQKVLMSYLSHVLDCKTLDYSLRKRVSKVVFRILSCEEDAEVVRRFLFPLFLRLCKDDVAIIRTYTASYFYLFLEKGCPQIYNFFKGGGEILPIEEYKKDRILTNGEKYKLRSRYFTGGAEIALIKTVLVMFARSCRFFDRQIFIKMCDGIINECPANLFLLYFLKPFANLSVDKVQVVRTTWDKCVISQLKKKGHFLNTINVY